MNEPKPKVQYSVWEEDASDEDQGGFWSMFDTIEDAVSNRPNGANVYRFTPAFAGRFKRSAVVVRLKKLKKAKTKTRNSG